jgi:hypothetical protein
VIDLTDDELADLMRVARRLEDADRERFFALVADLLRPFVTAGLEFGRREVEHAIAEARVQIEG